MITIDPTTGLTGLPVPLEFSAMPVGSVIQVVNATYSTSTSNATTTYVPTGLTATITPKFASSKIAVFVSHNTCSKSTGSSGNALNIKLLKNGVDLAYLGIYLGYTNSVVRSIFSHSSTYVDSPATTSATTYSTSFANVIASAEVFVQESSQPSTITLMEIKQ